MRATRRGARISLLFSFYNRLRSSVEPMTNNDAFSRMLIKLMSHFFCEFEILYFLPAVLGSDRYWVSIYWQYTGPGSTSLLDEGGARVLGYWLIYERLVQ